MIELLASVTEVTAQITGTLISAFAALIAYKTYKSNNSQLKINKKNKSSRQKVAQPSLSKNVVTLVDSKSLQKILLVDGSFLVCKSRSKSKDSFTDTLWKISLGELSGKDIRTNTISENNSSSQGIIYFGELKYESYSIGLHPSNQILMDSVSKLIS